MATTSLKHQSENYAQQILQLTTFCVTFVLLQI